MNKKIKILLINFFIFIVMVLCNSQVQAASASVSASNNNVSVGETVTITITINGASWNLNLSGAIQNSYADVTDDGLNTTKTYTTSFTPSSAGEHKITLTGTVTDTDLVTKANVNDGITITATENAPIENTPPVENTPAETVTKSKNANLKNLGIRPNDFKGFKPGTTSYNATVPNDVEQVEVYATPQDSKSKITGTGKQKLKEGKNELQVVVTAEDGTKKTYTINVTREALVEENITNTQSEENIIENETNVDEVNKESKNSDLVKLEIAGYTLTPKFSPNIYEYTLDVNGDMDKLDIVAEGANDNVKVEIVGNENFKDGENIITILVENQETKQNSTYQIVLNRTNVDIDTVNTTLNDAIKKANKVRYILIGVLVFVVICIIIFAIVKYKYKLAQEEFEEDDENILNEDEEDDDNNPLFKKVNAEEFKVTPKVTTIANNIIDEYENRKKDEEIKTNEEDDEDEDEEEEFFRRVKRKGKHF